MCIRDRVKSAKKIVKSRKFTTITLEHLKQMGVAVNRARYFVATGRKNSYLNHLTKDNLRAIVLNTTQSKYRTNSPQLSLF